jgi:two-component system, chemotaxis family, chemotaxis protein CheY
LATALNLSGLRVLVIDDHAFSRHVGMAALRSLNIKTLAEAETASEGLGLIQTFAPDLILVDWVMEGMDGITFVKTVRGNKGTNSRFLPIIMVSAYAELWRVREARDAGCNEFVVKPFAARTLYAKIRTIIENPRPFVDVPDGYFGPDRRRRNMPVDQERRKTNLRQG